MQPCANRILKGIVVPNPMTLTPLLSISPLALGGAAALFAALLWSIASFLFARVNPHIHALEINFLKGVSGLILLIILENITSILLLWYRKGGGQE